MIISIPLCIAKCKIFGIDIRFMVAEVKRLRKNLHLDEFNEKVEIIRNKALLKYEIEAKVFSMEDM